jgi:hypothetical protein
MISPFDVLKTAYMPGANARSFITSGSCAKSDPDRKIERNINKSLFIMFFFDSIKIIASGGLYKSLAEVV